jgi:hypothetical protein
MGKVTQSVKVKVTQGVRVLKHANGSDGIRKIVDWLVVFNENY